MNTTQRIRQYLDQNQLASVDELSRALDLTRADIHYHVRQMVNRGDLETHEQQLHHSGAGRPARLFKLTESVPIASCRLIISCLLKGQMSTSPGIASEQTIAEAISHAFLCSCPSTRNLILSPAIRLNRIVKELEVLGIHLTWEAGKKGPVIRIIKEPFTSLLFQEAFVIKITQTLIQEIKKEVA